VCVCGISGADGIDVLSAIAQQVQHGEVAKLLVELNPVGPHVGVQFLRCLVSFRMNDEGRAARTGARRHNVGTAARCQRVESSPGRAPASADLAREPHNKIISSRQPRDTVVWSRKEAQSARSGVISPCRGTLHPPTPTARPRALKASGPVDGVWSPLTKVCRRLSRYRFDGSDRRSALLQHHEKALGVRG
jgi:hypothetical protein